MQGPQRPAELGECAKGVSTFDRAAAMARGERLAANFTHRAALEVLCAAGLHNCEKPLCNSLADSR